MCLRTCGLSLTYDSKTKDFVGVGYKIVSDHVVERMGKRWHAAKFNMEIGSGVTPTARIRSERGPVNYPPGFHIFLDKRAAQGYSTYHDRKKIVKVLFRDVVAFGTNKIKVSYNSRLSQPCVVARYMKIDEVLTECTHTNGHACR